MIGTIVAFAGLPGSGKNHMAAVLYRTLGFMPMTLALPFKLEAVALHGLPFEEVFGSTKSPETRDHLRKMGTERGRDVLGQDVWVQHADVLMRYYQTFGMKRFAFTDVRFPNELEYVRRQGGKLVYLLGGEDDLPDGHASESYHGVLRKSADAVIDNSRRDPGAERETLLYAAEWIVHNIFDF